MNGLRMPHLNTATISGRLTRDPELRYMQSGTPVFRARLANNTFYKSADGEWKRETAYIGIVAWQALAERCYENLQRGSAVIVTGRLVSVEINQQDKGTIHSSMEIRADKVQFLDRTAGGEADDSPPVVSELAGDPDEAAESHELEEDRAGDPGA